MNRKCFRYGLRRSHQQASKRVRAVTYRTRRLQCGKVEEGEEGLKTKGSSSAEEGTGQKAGDRFGETVRPITKYRLVKDEDGKYMAVEVEVDADGNKIRKESIVEIPNKKIYAQQSGEIVKNVKQKENEKEKERADTDSTERMRQVSVQAGDGEEMVTNTTR